MLIDLRRCLRATVAIRDLEIEGCDFMVAEGAFEGRAAIHRVGCVISHIFNPSPSICLRFARDWGDRCATLGQANETLVTYVTL